MNIYSNDQAYMEIVNCREISIHRKVRQEGSFFDIISSVSDLQTL